MATQTKAEEADIDQEFEFKSMEISADQRSMNGLRVALEGSEGLSNGGRLETLDARAKATRPLECQIHGQESGLKRRRHSVVSSDEPKALAKERGYEEGPAGAGLTFAR